MRGLLSAALAAAVLASVACQEKIATPAECPELCPGTGLNVREVVLLPIADGDSSYYGYLGYKGVTSLLVSNGIAAGEARAMATFPAEPDSVFVDGVRYAYSIDSMAIRVTLVARDSTVGGLKLFFHRITPTIDSTTTLAGVDAQLTPATLIDSLMVPDSVRRDTLRLIVKGDALTRMVPFEGDTGRVGIGIRLAASEPTGIRLDLFSAAPSITTWVHAAVTDTAKQRQSFTTGSDNANYVIADPPPAPPGSLFLGGRLASRTLIRFALPKAIKDSATPIRATLELTPVEPLTGLRNDPPNLELSAVLADLGPKSPALFGVSTSAVLGVGTAAVQTAEVLSLVTTWFSPAASPPTAILLALSPEGGTFSRPLFRSGRSPDGAPRLRITYVVPTRPGHP